MSKIAKIAISLPEDVLTAVEQAREDSGESRSQFFRRAAETMLRNQREQELSKRYLRAYKRNPETKKEIEAARRAATNILAEEPWE